MMRRIKIPGRKIVKRRLTPVEKFVASMGKARAMQVRAERILEKANETVVEAEFFLE